MTPPIEVTQADREAAASLGEWLTTAQKNWAGREIWFMPDFPRACRAGVWDHHAFVQAFAGRRTAAREQALREAAGVARDERSGAIVLRDMAREDGDATGAFVHAAEVATANLIHTAILALIGEGGK